MNTVLPGEFDPDRPHAVLQSISPPMGIIGPEVPPSDDDLRAITERVGEGRSLFAAGASKLAAGEPLAVTRFFWPDLLLREGWVFLADGFADDALAVWKESDYFKEAGMRGVCAAMNHRHVVDLLPSVSKLGDESFGHLGYVIGSCWEMRIRRAFPERQFEFQCGEEIWFWEGAPS